MFTWRYTSCKLDEVVMACKDKCWAKNINIRSMATCGYLEEWLWEGHEEVVREIEVLEGGQDGEHRWVQMHQVVGAEKEGSYVCVLELHSQ